MTLRAFALALAVALALPAIVGAARMALAARDPDETAARRRLEALWVAVPVVLLTALVALSVAA
jgi:heme/copper-type cytochrome/quinol oxidase subunit 2